MNTVETLPPLGRRHDLDLAANRLPSTAALDGSDVVLELDDGGTLELRFAAGAAEWSLDDDTTVRGGLDPYDAVEIRPGMFFVDFSASAGDCAVSVVLDRDRGRAVVLVGELVDRAGRLDVTSSASAARVAGKARFLPIAPTAELTGRRLFCEYSDGVALEHIYLNSRAVGWQWLKTPIADLAHEAGIDVATFWKVDDALYLLQGEGDDGAVLTLLLDFAQRRNVGRLFGISYAGRLDVRCGAHITLLGTTEYAESHHPG